VTSDSSTVEADTLAAATAAEHAGTAAARSGGGAVARIDCGDQGEGGVAITARGEGGNDQQGGGGSQPGKAVARNMRGKQ